MGTLKKIQHWVKWTLGVHQKKVNQKIPIQKKFEWTLPRTVPPVQVFTKKWTAFALPQLCKNVVFVDLFLNVEVFFYWGVVFTRIFLNRDFSGFFGLLFLVNTQCSLHSVLNFFSVPIFPISVHLDLI